MFILQLRTRLKNFLFAAACFLATRAFFINDLIFLVTLLCYIRVICFTSKNRRNPLTRTIKCSIRIQKSFKLFQALPLEKGVDLRCFLTFNLKL